MAIYHYANRPNVLTTYVSWFLNCFSLLYVQTLFYVTLFTLAQPTACILLRFVNLQINGSSIGAVTMTLTRWPSYTNLTRIPWRCTSRPRWTFYVKALESYADRQTHTVYNYRHFFWHWVIPRVQLIERFDKCRFLEWLLSCGLCPLSLCNLLIACILSVCLSVHISV